jgi:hypothetical protein
MVAHAVSAEGADKDLFHKALAFEADWSLGRNPLNMIQMTTASTSLAAKRSVENCYTSGYNDGTPGLHPGHTPYMNIDDWACGMVMGCPSWLYKKGYPADFTKWPMAEAYFNTRYVWAHSEFTPQQTMRGKTALYGYLYGIGTRHSGSVTHRIGSGMRAGGGRLDGILTIGSARVRIPAVDNGTVRLLDLSGRVLWSGVRSLAVPVSLPAQVTRTNGVVLVEIAAPAMPVFRTRILYTR